MVSGIEQNFNHKYIVTNLCCSVCSGIEDEPFGSEMCYGRGVCDTDPIQKFGDKKTWGIEDNISVTATISIDDIALHEYSKDEQQHSVLNDYDFEKKHEIENQIFKNLMVGVPSFGMKSLVSKILQDFGKLCSEESKQEIKKGLANSCDRNSSQGTSKSDTLNGSIVSIRSPIVHAEFCEESKVLYEAPVRREFVRKTIKPVGPFTEPPNPGKQMKLGEPYRVHSRVAKDFYKDF